MSKIINKKNIERKQYRSENINKKYLMGKVAEHKPEQDKETKTEDDGKEDEKNRR